jgi:hypothetical protein
VPIVQHTPARGAGNFGSAKGIDAPFSVICRRASQTRHPLAGFESARALVTAALQTKVSLVGRIAPQKFPSQIARAQVEQIVVGPCIERPTGTNIVSQTRHDVAGAYLKRGILLI